MPNPEPKEAAVTVETEDLQLAHHLADVADALSMRRFSRDAVAARRTPDGTAVSAADVEI